MKIKIDSESGQSKKQLWDLDPRSRLLKIKRRYTISIFFQVAFDLFQATFVSATSNRLFHFEVLYWHIPLLAILNIHHYWVSHA